jgi:tRNA1Val (adenine37-N6)-methyltransferase
MIKYESGKYIKKVMRKSYPNFVAPGPMPPGDCGHAHLIEQEGEELCYLVGNWRIFQHIGRHRYSTDDLVTSWVACREVRRMGAVDPLVLDIGCGIGSVLMSNAWQLPTARCVGIEAQEDRYKQALRSVEYNVGPFHLQERIRLFNRDIRDTDNYLLREFIEGFDMITGTPPYFGTDQGALPGCFESAGCLFELRGGVEAYCDAAARYLRKPLGDSIKRSKPSLFVMCNTSLASSRVYLAAASAGLSIVHRVDVLPCTNKLPLFTIFIMTLNDWIIECQDLFPILSPELPSLPFEPQNATRISGSLRGETYENICVRDEARNHTVLYQDILADLGKPSSQDKEIYVPGAALCF